MKKTVRRAGVHGGPKTSERSELIEEDLGHVEKIVLARVDEALLLSEHVRKRGHLDYLGPCPDDYSGA